MVVGICTLEIYLPSSGSLKNKRQILKSLKDRIKQRFNISIAEIDHQDLWQRCILGIACVGNDKGYVNGTLDRVIALVRSVPLIEIIRYDLQII